MWLYVFVGNKEIDKINISRMKTNETEMLLTAYEHIYKNIRLEYKNE